MNTNRILGSGRSFYHCVTRTAGRIFIFRSAKDKEICRKIMRKLEKLLSVRVVTYCFMDNHIHLLLEVPAKADLTPLTEAELLEILPTLYDDTYCLTVKQELERAHAISNEDLRNEAVAAILGRYEARRADLSIFMKEFKHRVTKYINKEHDRVGTLWESRFKSVLVQGNEGALLTMAAYIDLNPVRAGMVERPEDYRWCGYAEALAGGKLARQGLGTILSEGLMDPDMKTDWRRTRNRYRLFVYSEGEEMEADMAKGDRGRKGVSREEVETVEQNDGAIPVRDLLRHKVRYFCDGAVLGTAEFVNEVFEREREANANRKLQRFSDARKTGARKMRGADWGELCVLRDLQI